MREPSLILGAGLIGLACARRLAMDGHEVLILERNATFGEETSSRNSEVIHAGLYYPPGSWKARLCVTGREALYAYCGDHPVPYRKTGKWIVATAPAQVTRLEEIAHRAAVNGVPTAWVPAPRIQSEEPALHAVAALESPETGIIDVHALMLSLLGDAERAGAQLVTHTDVVGLQPDGDGFVVHYRQDGEHEIRAGRVVNAAGHGAPALAEQCAGKLAGRIPAPAFARGNYFACGGASPFRRLVYPVPEQGGLGIHVTLDLAGQARFGPDVEWLDLPDHNVNEARKPLFVEAIRRYWPGVDADRLQPAYAGIRPWLGKPGNRHEDFMILGPRDHGVPGLVHLLGIDSPGLTCSLPIAEVVASMLSGGG